MVLNVILLSVKRFHQASSLAPPLLPQHPGQDIDLSPHPGCQHCEGEDCPVHRGTPGMLRGRHRLAEKTNQSQSGNIKWFWKRDGIRGAHFLSHRNPPSTGKYKHILFRFAFFFFLKLYEDKSQ